VRFQNPTDNTGYTSLKRLIYSPLNNKFELILKFIKIMKLDLERIGVTQLHSLRRGSCHSLGVVYYNMRFNL